MANRFSALVLKLPIPKSSFERALEAGLDPHAKQSLQHPTIAAGKLPRGRKFEPLVPEFRCVQTVRVPSVPEPLLSTKSTLIQVYHGIPAGSKLLRTSRLDRSKGGVKTAEGCEAEDVATRVFGIYHNPSEFIEVAKAAQHPLDTIHALPDQAIRCIFETLTLGPLGIARKRLQKLKQWQAWADESVTDELVLRASMDAGCERVLKSKRLVLLEKIANSLQWPDTDLHDQLRSGFKLTGHQKPSGVFGPDIKPGTQSRQDLADQCSVLQKAIWDKIASSREAEWSEPLWEITMKEVHEKQWLAGPYSRAELDVLFDGVWVPVRRFAVWQREKWRPIDDFSECGVNSTFSCLEKVDLRALDESVLVARLLSWFSCREKQIEFCLKNGERLVGEVHPFWTQVTGAADLVMKTVDLKSAYKQLAMNPCDQRFAVLALKKPGSTEVSGFVCKTLPFGSSASVLHFNRVARLLQRIGHELLVNWCNFYDDYPVVTFRALAKGTDLTIRALLKLVGFEWAADKDMEFSPCSDLLGVSLDLAAAQGGTIAVGNKVSRMVELRRSVEQLISERQVGPRMLPSLFGRALFVESNLLGRAGKLALSDLRLLEHSKKRIVRLQESELKALRLLLARYVVAKPRQVPSWFGESPILVFTDGACEPGQGSLVVTVGGVLFHPAESHARAFGVNVPDEVVAAWIKEGKEHPVPQTELYAVVLARSHWKGLIDGFRCVFFVDNQGSLDACIKGYSRVGSMRDLLLEYEELDAPCPVLPWFARVPSLSNVADFPSRGKWKALSEVVKRQVEEPVCFRTEKRLKSLQSTD